MESSPGLELDSGFPPPKGLPSLRPLITAPRPLTSNLASFQAQFISFEIVDSKDDETADGASGLEKSPTPNEELTIAEESKPIKSDSTRRSKSKKNNKTIRSKPSNLNGNQSEPEPIAKVESEPQTVELAPSAASP